MKTFQALGAMVALCLFCSAGAAAQQSSDLSAAPNVPPAFCCAGTPGTIPLYRTRTSFANSNIFQSASGYVGVGTLTPVTELHAYKAFPLGQGGPSGTIQSSDPSAFNIVRVLNISRDNQSNARNESGELGTEIGIQGPGVFGGLNDYAWIDAVLTGNTVSDLYFSVQGPGEILRLAGTGNVGIGTSGPSNILTVAQGRGDVLADGYATYSSARWKTKIHTLRDALEKVEKLRGVSYSRVDNGKPEIGVIAEEVDAVIPQVVSHDPKSNEALGVDYSRLSALLIEAVKSQQAEIDQLKAQVRQLALRP